MTEAALAELGVHRVPIPIPFPQAGGPVNVYLVLEAGFRALGRRFDEVTRIVVSHGHVDHYGAARFVQERHGGELPVFVHPADAGKISEAGPRWRDRAPVYAAYLARQGLPPEVVEVVGRSGERSFGMARRVAAVHELHDCDRLR